MFRIKMVAWKKAGGLNNTNNLFNNSFNKKLPKYIPIKEYSEQVSHYDKNNVDNSAYKEIKVNKKSDSSSRSNYSKASSSYLSNTENKFNYFFNNLNIGKEYKHSNKPNSLSKDTNAELNDFKYNISPNKNSDREKSDKVDNNKLQNNSNEIQNNSNEKSYVKVQDSSNYNTIGNPSNSGFSFPRTHDMVKEMKYVKVEDTDSLFSELLKKREERERNFLKRPSEPFNNKASNKRLDRFPPPFRSRFYF